MLLILLTSALFICLFYIIVAKEPVHAVFSFIAVVLCLVGFLFLLNAEIFALLFLMVYLGAIIVLFLFVTMMLGGRTKYASDGVSSQTGSTWISTFVVMLLLKVLGALYSALRQVLPLRGVSTGGPDLFAELEYHSSTIQLLALHLYSHFGPLLTISGVILLVALVGSMVLTAKRNNTVDQC